MLSWWESSCWERTFRDVPHTRGVSTVVKNDKESCPSKGVMKSQPSVAWPIWKLSDLASGTDHLSQTHLLPPDSLLSLRLIRLPGSARSLPTGLNSISVLLIRLARITVQTLFFFVHLSWRVRLVPLVLTSHIFYSCRQDPRSLLVPHILTGFSLFINKRKA